MTMLGTLLQRLSPTADISRVALNAHEEMLSALTAKDRKRTLAALERHLEEVSTRLQSLYT
jgi:DNA-binding GntR family transcriptional regulator